MVIISQRIIQTSLQCALRQNVLVCSPSWVLDAYDAWLKAEPVDTCALAEAHRLGMFQGLNISVTGLGDATRRNRALKEIRARGGRYEEALVMANCTHLLGSTRDTTKVRAVQRWNKEVEAEQLKGKPKDDAKPKKPVRLLWDRWLWDSLNKGGEQIRGPSRATKLTLLRSSTTRRRL